MISTISENEKQKTKQNNNNNRKWSFTDYKTNKKQKQ